MFTEHLVNRDIILSHRVTYHPTVVLRPKEQRWLWDVSNLKLNWIIWRTHFSNWIVWKRRWFSFNSKI